MSDVEIYILERNVCQGAPILDRRVSSGMGGGRGSRVMRTIQIDPRRGMSAGLDRPSNLAV